jgi:hypothetical protein
MVGSVMFSRWLCRHSLTWEIAYGKEFCNEIVDQKDKLNSLLKGYRDVNQLLILVGSSDLTGEV